MERERIELLGGLRQVIEYNEVAYFGIIPAYVWVPNGHPSNTEKETNMKPIVLVVQARTVYGVEKIYPINSAAQQLAEIAGTKTLSRRALDTAAEMGMCVRVQPVIPACGDSFRLIGVQS